MRSFVELSRRSRWLSVSALTLMTAAVAGCSSETTRFGENPYASPYAAQDNTSSVAHAPAGRVESQPLPPQVHSQALPPPVVQRPQSVAATGVSGGSAGMGSFQPAPASYASASADITGSVTRPRPAPVVAAAPG